MEFSIKLHTINPGWPSVFIDNLRSKTKNNMNISGFSLKKVAYARLSLS